MRIEFDMNDFDESFSKLKEDLPEMAREYSMEWKLSGKGERKRMAIFVSKMDHCLLEPLWRWKSNELEVDISLVISNHPDMREVVEGFGIPYHHVPITPDTKAEAEQRRLKFARWKSGFHCTGEIYADSFAELYFQIPKQDYQHSSQLPAGLRGSQSLCTGV